MKSGNLIYGNPNGYKNTYVSVFFPWFDSSTNLLLCRILLGLGQIVEKSEDFA